MDTPCAGVYNFALLLDFVTGPLRTEASTNGLVERSLVSVVQPKHFRKVIKTAKLPSYFSCTLSCHKSNLKTSLKAGSLGQINILSAHTASLAIPSSSPVKMETDLRSKSVPTADQNHPPSNGSRRFWKNRRWNSLKDEIHQIYVKEDNTLETTMQRMEGKLGFEAKFGYDAYIYIAD